MSGFGGLMAIGAGLTATGQVIDKDYQYRMEQARQDSLVELESRKLDIMQRSEDSAASARTEQLRIMGAEAENTKAYQEGVLKIQEQEATDKGTYYKGLVEQAQAATRASDIDSAVAADKAYIEIGGQLVDEVLGRDATKGELEMMKILMNPDMVKEDGGTYTLEEAWAMVKESGMAGENEAPDLKKIGRLTQGLKSVWESTKGHYGQEWNLNKGLSYFPGLYDYTQDPTTGRVMRTGGSGVGLPEKNPAPLPTEEIPGDMSEAIDRSGALSPAAIGAGATGLMGGLQSFNENVLGPAGDFLFGKTQPATLAPQTFGATEGSSALPRQSILPAAAKGRAATAADTPLMRNPLGDPTGFGGITGPLSAQPKSLWDEPETTRGNKFIGGQNW